jgi:hypothetical protein
MDADEELVSHALKTRGLAPDPERIAAIAPALRSLLQRLRRLSESLPERADLPPNRLEPPRS